MSKDQDGEQVDTYKKSCTKLVDYILLIGVWFVERKKLKKGKTNHLH